MKKLYLLRHADTETEADSGKDVDRQLNDNGYKEITALNKVMIDKNFSCDIVLCSIAIRARQTCNRIIPSLAKECPVKYLEDLYYVDLNSVLKCLKKLSDNYKSVLVVSHNPTMGELATHLTNNPIHFKTCILKLLDINITSWLELTSECAKLAWSIPETKQNTNE